MHFVTKDNNAMHQPLLLLLLFASCSCNQYDPHVYPHNGPYFEGWYVRIVDLDSQLAMAVLFGKVLPEDTSSPQYHLGYAGLLVSGGGATSALTNYNCYCKPAEIHVTVKNGQPVTSNPDDLSPPDFVWLNDCLNFTVTPDATYIRMDTGNAHFSARIVDALPWGPVGEGPMGWLEYLPLPIAWFVYSTSSTVSQYDFRDDAHTSSQSGGGNIFAHMEKNWGASFPAAWVWAQGFQSNGTSFALTYGPVDMISSFSLIGFLAGYRNADRNISVDFRNVDSWSSVEMEACEGTFRLTLTSLVHSVEFDIMANRHSFSGCLPGPTKNGFVPVCEESFVGVARVTLWRRSWLAWTEVDTQQFPMAALEFGGQYTCCQECSVPRLLREHSAVPHDTSDSGHASHP